MIKALKVVLIIWAALGILVGLGYIFAPQQVGAMMGFEQGPAYVPYFLAMLGITYVTIGAFLIVAARDPIRNILWVQLAIVWAILAVAAAVYSMMRGFVTFEQAGVGLIIDSAFFVALMALYPYRAVRGAARRRK